MRALRLVLALLFLLLYSTANVQAAVSVDYIIDKKTILIKVDVGISQEDKPLILEIYVNRSLYRVYYFKENETFPKYIEVGLNISGQTYISARTYNKISGWGEMEEILVTASGLRNPELNLNRELALLVGTIFLISALFIFLKKRQK